MKYRIIVALITFVIAGVTMALIAPLLHSRPEQVGEAFFPIGIIASLIAFTLSKPQENDRS